MIAYAMSPNILRWNYSLLQVKFIFKNNRERVDLLILPVTHQINQKEIVVFTKYIEIIMILGDLINLCV